MISWYLWYVSVFLLITCIASQKVNLDLLHCANANWWPQTILAYNVDARGGGCSSHKKVHHAWTHAYSHNWGLTSLWLIHCAATPQPVLPFLWYILHLSIVCSMCTQHLNKQNWWCCSIVVHTKHRTPQLVQSHFGSCRVKGSRSQCGKYLLGPINDLALAMLATRS